MKQNSKIVIQIVVAAALLLTTGCSKEMEQGEGALYSDVQILAASELASDEVVAAKNSSRAAADPTKEMTFYLVRADETGNGTGVFGAYATTPLTATRAAGVGSQALSFATPQYYLASNAKTRLTGWYPAATSLVGSTARWTIDGATDILTAPEQGGNRNAPMPDLVFNHALSQVQIHAYAPDANAQATWGTITKIELVEQINTCTYDFATNCATGAVMPEIGTTGTFAVGNIATATIPVTVAAQVGDPVMIAPQATATVLKLEVTSSKLGKVEVSMPAGVYTQGKAYILKLKFNAFTITATASIGTWQTIDRTEQEVTPPPPPPPTVGDYYYSDGSFSTALEAGKTATGMIYYIDPANPKKYKVMSLDEAATTLKWAAKGTYVVSGAQSDTDGKANSAAIKAYFEDNTATVGQNFDVAFPAAAYCYNYRGMAGTDALGSWYLPAKSELQYLWCAYNGVAPISWEYNTDAAAPADAAAQTLWNDRIKGVGGAAGITSDYFWSSTERSYSASRAWYVVFIDGEVDGRGKSFAGSVRCVREL